jgi:ABC-type polysaccharide/polyol phosphate export permease
MTTISLRGRPTGFVSGSTGLSVPQRIKRVIEYRRILGLLVGRDLKVRYAGSFLGYFWTVLDPLLMSLVYWFIFTKVFHRGAGSHFQPYLLYLVTGLLAWQCFNSGVMGLLRALRGEAQMVRSTNVPRELWVVRVVGSKFIEYLFSMPILAAFGLAYMIRPSWYTLLLPLAWLIEITLLLGVGLILAPLTVLVRDLERVVPIVLRIMFYASPVIYAIDQAPANARPLFSFNPMVAVLQLTRAVFFPAALQQTTHVHRNGQVVTHVVNHWNWVWHSALTSVLLLVIGAYVFMRLERHVLKEI